MVRSFFLISVFILLLSLKLIGQSKNTMSSFGLDYSYGGILHHSKELPTVRDNRINGFNLSYSRILTTENKWEQCFCFPEIGFGVAYFDFGDLQMLGYSINSYMSVAPYLNPHGKFHFIPRFAGGLSYVSDVYDEIENPDNTFFSSHISGFLQLNLSLRYSFTSRFQISSSFSYNHISNGGLKLPNKGMNFITADVGLKYFLQENKFPEYEVDISPSGKINRWRYRINTSYTMKVAQKENDYDRKNTSVIGILATTGYFIPRFSIIEGGVEFISDRHLKEQLRRQFVNKDYNRFSLIIGHTAKFGRLGFSTLLGVYLYSPVKVMDPVYQRYQLTYDLPKYLYAGVGLKAHRHVAELMMVNVGLRL